MRICIVGAGGQVGGVVFDRLRKTGCDVFGVTRNNFTAGPLLDAGFEVRVGSLRDAGKARELLESADLIVNAALTLGLPKEARGQNELLLERAMSEGGGAHVVHLSTVAVYGSCIDAPASTFERPRPDSTYAREKLLLEQFALSRAKQLDAALTVLRLGHVYGPRQGWSAQIFELLQSPTWKLPFRGAIESNAIHVHRLADALAALPRPDAKPSVLNAVNNPQRTWSEVFRLHSEAADLPDMPGLPEEESTRHRRALQAAAKSMVARRAAKQTGEWLRDISLKRLADKSGIRELMDRAMIALPHGFERMVGTRYKMFSAAQQLPVAGTGAIAPPWFFSEPVPGPKLSMRPPSELDEKRELAAWYAEWGEPLWTVPRP